MLHRATRSKVGELSEGRVALDIKEAVNRAFSARRSRQLATPTQPSVPVVSRVGFRLEQCMFSYTAMFVSFSGLPTRIS